MKVFKFKKTAYSNFILTNILIVIMPNFCLSQNVNLEKDGLKFRCNVYISTYKKTGADGGEYPVIKTGSFNCQCIGGSISYGGKAYDKNSFNGELYNSIQAVQVKSLRIKGEFPNTILGGINTIDFCFEPNEEKGNNLRSLKKGSHLDGNVNILSICSLSGVNSVIEKIKELEKEKAEKEKAEFIQEQLQKAQTHYANKQFEDALDYLQDALQKDPSNASVLAAKKNVVDAQNAAALEEKKQITISKLLRQAEELVARKEFSQAITRYNQVLQLNSSETNAISGLKFANEALEENKTALQKEIDAKLRKQNQDADHFRNKAKADSAAAAHANYLNDKWKQDSILIQQQWKQQQINKQERQQLYTKLVNQYAQSLTNAFNKAESNFTSLSPAEQQKRCDEAEGIAATAALLIEMQEFGKGSKLYQQAALLCPTHTKAYLWMDYSVVDFSSSLYKREWDQQKTQDIAFQKKQLELLEITRNYTNSQVSDLYNKFQIEQGYKRLYEQAQRDVDQYYNLFGKMSTVGIKFSDPATLDNFINTRIKTIEANFTKAMNAAANKAGASFNQTYAQTGSASTATKVAVVQGAGDVLSNSIVAEGAKKSLRLERERQLKEIAEEFVRKLYDNCNASLERMLVAKTAAEDRKAFSEFIYNYKRLHYACANFNYNSNNWYYYKDFSTASETDPLTTISFLDKTNEQLCAAQRKVYFYDQFIKYKPPTKNSLDLYAMGWEFNDARFLSEARAYLSTAIKQNTKNADAYYLMADISFSKPTQFSYAFTAATYAGSSAKRHFSGYLEKQQAALRSYLLQLITKTDANSRSEWESVIYYRLYNQLPVNDLQYLISTIVADERTSYLTMLLNLDKTYRASGILQSLMLDAIRLSRMNSVAALQSFLPANTQITGGGTPVNLWQLCLLENKPLAFAGLTNNKTDYQELAGGMDIFEGNFSPDNIYHCFVEAAVQHNTFVPLQYIQSVEPAYLTAHPEIIEKAMALGERGEIVFWLYDNKYASTEVMSQQLFKATTYKDLASLLSLQVNTNITDKESGYGVLHHHLKRLFNESNSGRPIDPASGRPYFQFLNAHTKELNQLVQLLLKKNAPVSIVGNDKETVFHTAATIGDLQIMKRLVQAANLAGKLNVTGLLNRQNKDGQTALHIAVKNNFQALASYLVYAGASTSIKDVTGVSPAQLASKANFKFLDLAGFSKTDWLNFIIEEDLLATGKMNKRETIGAVETIIPVPYTSAFGLSQYNAVMAKKFPAFLDIQKSGYLRSGEFSNALKYHLSNRSLCNNINTLWQIDHEGEITTLELMNTKADGNNTLILTYMLTCKGLSGNTTSLLADLNIYLYYNPTTQKITIDRDDRTCFNITNVQLQKTIPPGEAVVFYKPSLFLTGNDNILQTAYSYHYDSKAKEQNDRIAAFFIKMYKINIYKDLLIRDNPEFVFIENKGKTNTAITAFWK